METLQNLPWYTYVILGVAVLAYILRHFLSSSKDERQDAQFLSSTKDALSGERLFSISLDAVITEWWEVNTNTLRFKNDKKFNETHFNNYLEGWGINTKQGYWSLTEYFMQDGRRWYFDFIYNMIKTEPKENWDALMNEKFGGNERANRYLRMLSSGEALTTLKSKGYIAFESEFDLGVAGYDASILVGQARRAFTAGLISEEEAWKVIEFATALARKHFTSWEEFGKSFILGFTLDIRDQKDGYLEDMYHLYGQVVNDSRSPWNTVAW